MRKKKKKLNAGTEARRKARKAGLSPSGTRVIPDKRRKPEKHKKRLVAEVEGIEFHVGRERVTLTPVVFVQDAEAIEKKCLRAEIKCSGLRN